MAKQIILTMDSDKFRKMLSEDNTIITTDSITGQFDGNNNTQTEINGKLETESKKLDFIIVGRGEPSPSDLRVGGMYFEKLE